MGVSVNAFRVQGDPEIFPVELRHIAKHNDCSVALLPWRPNSEYLQKLFWSTAASLDVPVALVVCKGTHAVARPHAPTLADLNTHVTPSKPRSNSVYAAAFNVKTTTKVTTNKSNGVAEIVAILSGNSGSDMIITSLIMRFATNMSYTITVYLPADFDEFDSELLSNIQAFISNSAKHSNVKVVNLVAASQDLEGIFKESFSPSADLYVCAFTEPFTAVPMVPLTGELV